jgi:hypothetical protein
VSSWPWPPCASTRITDPFGGLLILIFGAIAVLVGGGMLLASFTGK